MGETDVHDEAEAEVAARRAEGAAKRRRGRTLAGAVVAVAAIMIALLLYFGWIAPYFASSHTPPGDSGSGGVPPVNQSLQGTNGCNAASSLTPSALLMPISAPTAPLSPNGQLVANYELAVVNFTSADSGVNIYMPSLTVVFPTTTGNPLEMVYPPATIQPSGPGWESPSFATRSTSVTTAVDFTTSPSYITSSRLAVMSTVPYGQLALEVRWHWTMTEPNGSTLQSNWTTPTANVDWPTSLPSIFLPAPLVTIVQTSGSTWTIGANYTIWLGGATGARNFTLELEPAMSGQSIQKAVTTIPPGNASSTPVQVVMLGQNGIMLPGAYLIHVHDSCGALLRSVSVNTIYAPNATVLFQIQPTSCGISFNGTTYFSGQSAVVLPGPTAIPFDVGTCNGASYSSLTTSGGLHMESTSEILVSSDGTLAATYP